MSTRMGGLIGAFRAGAGRALFAAGRRAQKRLATLRGASKRAYAFEVYAREAVARLWEEGAVYCYARPEPARTEAAGFQIGYIGRTSDMAHQDGEHERLQHFAGHGLDTVLLLRIAQETIRRDVERDLVALHNPPLNELIRAASRTGVI